MTPIETARLLAEVLAILGIIGTGFLWIAKLLWKTHSKLDGVNEGLSAVNAHLKQLNGSVARHEDELSKQRELNAYLKGTLGVPMEKEGIPHEPQGSP